MTDAPTTNAAVIAMSSASVRMKASSGDMKKIRDAFFPLPLWERVARPKSGPGEGGGGGGGRWGGGGSGKTRVCPLTRLRFAKPPSPTRGEGKSAANAHTR